MTNVTKKILTLLFFAGLAAIYSFGYKTCLVKELDIKFSCPRTTVVQYWQNTSYLDYVTVATKPIRISQETDNPFYKGGFIFYKHELEEEYKNAVSAGEYIERIIEEERANQAAGSLPSAPGPPEIVNIEAPRLPQWLGAITVKDGLGNTEYVAIKDGFIYKLRINDGEMFKNSDLTKMLSSLRWIE